MIGKYISYSSTTEIFDKRSLVTESIYVHISLAIFPNVQIRSHNLSFKIRDSPITFTSFIFFIFKIRVLISITYNVSSIRSFGISTKTYSSLRNSTNVPALLLLWGAATTPLILRLLLQLPSPPKQTFPHREGRGPRLKHFWGQKPAHKQPETIQCCHKSLKFWASQIKISEAGKSSNAA